jgi:hypothetical protein
MSDDFSSAILRRGLDSSSRERFDTFPLMMEAEMVSETLGFYQKLTRLFVREKYIV